ncbi:MAG: 1-deoxy-D-xylulose-5-phosphate reductoisomerase [Candidatus Poriferisodalaceae bacterium]|jgi:1-deoxy-D-xylulose-5-phosphate reductoisomerase
MSDPVTVGVLGCSGSIGTQTADVVRAEKDRYSIEALAAWSSVDVLVAQAREFSPAAVAIGRAELRQRVIDGVPAGTEVLTGAEGFAELARRCDVAVNGVVGFAGLGVTIAALESGKRLALANKESLIAAGPIVQPLRETPGAELIPVDSEHCAVHQCLRADGPGVAGSAHLSELVITASGGPFRGRTPDSLADVTVDQALAHPTWSMGPKITIDSSTLMNKGLEVIEAHELFGVGYDDINVVVHPQSVVHSMATFTDGTTIAQLSMPDMRLPIGYALAYPQRITTAFGSIDWSTVGSLDFEAPDRETFVCLDLCYSAGRIGGTAPAWLNGANEAAVEAFLAGRITWVGIGEVLTDALAAHDGAHADSIEAVIEADRRGRSFVNRVLQQRA